MLAVGGCEWNSETTHDAATRHDARPMRDGGGDDGSVAGAHLLLTEIALAPPGGEFVEITNPSTAAVSLAGYYLADNGDYWKLPAGAPTINISDFIVAFPATAMIPPGGTITVATGTATTFMTAYGMAPTYSIADSTVTKTVVPGTPTLTDAGEIVVLFHWDGSADLVDDIDMMIAGMPTATNTLVSKSG
ncbi:MAG TPA: lamin tail domain-containing protein, partial [Kofleriaceae bacterium]